MPDITRISSPMPPTKKNPFLRRRKKSRMPRTNAAGMRLPREVLQEYGRRGAARLKELGKTHIFTDEDRKISAMKRAGTLPDPLTYTYSIQERREAAAKAKQAEELKAFLAERAKLFGRDKNLPKGLNVLNEKDPNKNDKSNG